MITLRCSQNPEMFSSIKYVYLIINRTAANSNILMLRYYLNILKLGYITIKLHLNDAGVSENIINNIIEWYEGQLEEFKYYDNMKNG